MYRQFSISFLVFISFSITTLSQSYSPAKVKAIWIYNIIEETTWPNENSIDTFKLGIYNPEQEFYDYLKLISENKLVKNKPLRLYDLKGNEVSDLDLIYLNGAIGPTLNYLLEKANQMKVLSIIDNTSSSDAMIEFVQRNKSLNISINDQLLKQRGFKISPRLVAMVTQSEELKTLYIEAESQLAKEQNLVRQQQIRIAENEAQLKEISKELKQKIEELEVKNKEIKLQKELLEQQEKDIKEKQAELLRLNNTINSRQLELSKKTEELKTKELELNRQKDIIAIQQNSINQQLITLNQQQSEIDDKKRTIDEQQDQVYDLIEKGQSQKIILRLVFVLLLLAVITTVFIIRNLNIKKRVNRTLKNQNREILEKNEEIQQQKEELNARTELLTEINTELEKLTLAAKKTDNAIALYDHEGNIEWVNESFVKFHKKDVTEFIESFGANIVNHSFSLEIHDIFNEAVEKQKSVTYQNKLVNPEGEVFWFQSTLTPIFDEYDKLKRFIIVDSDISRIKETQELLDQKNKDITDSIIYAERIQTAILPSSEKIKQAFENSFVFYNPRDIISGDFYWFHVKREKIYFAVADCTGHGVPGALISVIGYSSLNEIVNKDKTGNPGKILDKLRKDIIVKLQQSHSNDLPLDGMDISLCVFNKNDYKLNFAGANQFIYLIRDNEIKDFRGDHMPIALFDRMDNFTTIEIELKKGDMIYLFSDGYADQIGGSKGSKYKYWRFRSLLTKVSIFPTEKQEQIITTEFNNWKKNYDQIDDVILMGIRF